MDSEKYSYNEELVEKLKVEAEKLNGTPYFVTAEEASKIGLAERIQLAYRGIRCQHDEKRRPIYVWKLDVEAIERLTRK